MRRISITGVLLFCLLCLGCGALEEFEKTQQFNELYVRNWSIAQLNLEQNQQSIEETPWDSNESQQESDLPTEVYEPNQSEIYTTDIDVNDIELPIESIFQYKGITGCIAAIPYENTIYQNGDVVVIKKVGSRTDNTIYSLPINKFKVFWLFFSSFDIMSFGESYGEMWSTADFTGDLIIDIVTTEGRLNKKIGIEGSIINDNEFKKLLYTIKWLADENAQDSDLLRIFKD